MYLTCLRWTYKKIHMLDIGVSNIYFTHVKHLFNMCGPKYVFKIHVCEHYFCVHCTWLPRKQIYELYLIRTEYRHRINFFIFHLFLMQYSQQAGWTDYFLPVLTLSIWIQISFMIDDETIYIFIVSWCSIYKLLGWEISVYNQSYLCAQQVSV